MELFIVLHSLNILDHYFWFAVMFPVYGRVGDAPVRRQSSQQDSQASNERAQNLQSVCNQLWQAYCWAPASGGFAQGPAMLGALPQQALTLAIENHSIETIHWLCGMSISPMADPDRSRPFVERAVSIGFYEVAFALLECAAKSQQSIACYEHALYLACELGLAPMVRQLMGVDPIAQRGSGVALIGSDTLAQLVQHAADPSSSGVAQFVECFESSGRVLSPGATLPQLRDWLSYYRHDPLSAAEVLLDSTNLVHSRPAFQAVREILGDLDGGLTLGHNASLESLVKGINLTTHGVELLCKACFIREAELVNNFLDKSSPLGSNMPNHSAYHLFDWAFSLSQNNQPHHLNYLYDQDALDRAEPFNRALIDACAAGNLELVRSLVHEGIALVPDEMASRLCATAIEDPVTQIDVFLQLEGLSIVAGRVRGINAAQARIGFINEASLGVADAARAIVRYTNFRFSVVAQLALELAAEKGRSDVVRFLVEAPQIEFSHEEMEQALYCAASVPQLEVCGVLLDTLPDPRLAASASIRAANRHDDRTELAELFLRHEGLAVREIERLKGLSSANRGEPIPAQEDRFASAQLLLLGHPRLQGVVRSLQDGSLEQLRAMATELAKLQGSGNDLVVRHILDYLPESMFYTLLPGAPSLENRIEGVKAWVQNTILSNLDT